MKRLITNWLAARAVADPDNTALVTDVERLTFRELRGRVDEVALSMARAGIRPGDRIGLRATGCRFVVCLHALSRIGAVAVPLNIRLTPSELRAQLDAVQAVGVLDNQHGTPSGAVSTLDAEPGSSTRMAWSGHDFLVDGVGLTRTASMNRAAMESRPLAGPVLLDRFNVDDLHSLIFTSGTTGWSKPVMLTHGNHWWNAMGSLLNLGSHPTDLWLDCLPLYHVGGLAIMLRSVIYGVPVVLHPGFDAEAVNLAIDRGDVTVVSLVPTMLHRVLDHRHHRPFPSSLRCILLGGGPTPGPLLEACLDIAAPIAPTYGMTETASQAATLGPNLVAAHPGSSGRALLGVEIAIVRGDDNTDPSEAGEIVLRGPAVSPGYWPPSIQHSAFGIQHSADGKSRPWFHTGDAGRLDDQGYLYIAGRCDDMIVTGGENVHPAEVESILTSNAQVVDAAVFGLPDAEWGQTVAAAVVLSDPNVDLDQIRQFCRDRLPRFRCPKTLLVMDSLPRTPSGKLLRRGLAEEVQRSKFNVQNPARIQR